ncbi:reverse transcriptase homolog [Tolypothrix tenuis PCC 7101]|uniref:Reverse transcriptase homolog n=1 Tax=Tolypothrix tenuis PCC 7101 TaxID=231146 RepID=A0A1Z4NAI4_9CYAN|nr:reverse transcriptase N-terminal domain-containing protein [Aulosira sp. FACHB-113]BAZ02682.1 reverse transcriptase homolog [Tolypothrix tenuis PCC 7101]BAZ78425.1 reverse transcriptase homolog [Aulosira laxa NIES-50]
MIRHSKELTSESWKSLPWKKFRANLFRLQMRVFKAVRVGDKRKARSLQKLILKSKAARFLAIRQVTQLNAGKKTAGIDGKLALTYEERFNLELTLRQPYWYHNKLRQIPIPKKDGSLRYLKVPTIADRAWQCLAKYALEPAHEATFHEHSYGFRTGRSAHDAQRQVFLNLSSKANGITKRILELDIEKCFDRINHTTIMDNLIAPRALKDGIFRALKAGINPEFPEQGTPQGGVVSPLLANIALNGIEELHQYNRHLGSKITKHTKKEDIKSACVRYADDMVFFLRPEDDADKLLDKISQFLAKRGLKVSEKKTKLTASTEGFDFLGWKFKVQQNGKFRCVPSEENYKAFRKKVKKIVNCPNYGAKVKAAKLAPIVRGWRQYHKYCKMNGSRFSLWFMNHRAFKVFNKEIRQDKKSAEKLTKQAFPAVPYSENAHIKVKGNKSPFDGDLVYWSERNSKLYDDTTSKQLKKQNHTCGYCKLKLTSEEKVHLHHIDGNHGNWKSHNLMVVHESCHDYIHMSKR